MVITSAKQPTIKRLQPMTTIDLGNLTVVVSHIVGFEHLPDNRWKMLLTNNYNVNIDSEVKDQVIEIINQAS